MPANMEKKLPVVQSPTADWEANIINDCIKLQKRIKYSDTAMSVLIALIVVDAVSLFFSMIIYASSDAALAGAIFVVCLCLAPLLILGIIFCPTPNPYGTKLMVAANKLPNNTDAMMHLKRRLIDEAEDAIKWH